MMLVFSNISVLLLDLGMLLLFSGLFKLTRYAFALNLALILLLLFTLVATGRIGLTNGLLWITSPLLLALSALYVFLSPEADTTQNQKKYQVSLPLKNGSFKIGDVRRGVSIIGSAGSGKTESVVYSFLRHFAKENFCGIIHDYKDFELTEMAYPLFQKSNVPFYTVAFDKIIHRINPIAPKYLENEESVNEVSRVLIENLLELKGAISDGSTKFFMDAAESLLAGLIWKQKVHYPKYCTLPHIIAIFQLLDTDSLAKYLSTDVTAKALADTFLTGKDSSKQTAGVKSTLANGFKKMSSRTVFMALSVDEVPLNINHENNPAVVSIVNNPKYETAYSPIIATIMHSITKQISVRNRQSSFILMEEAPTIRLPNMQRIPATLRSYDISTLYVMQDKIQNDILYGEKVSKAILSNLSYQFFGKVNDPDTAKYYERFFELVKQPTKSVSKGLDPFRADTRVTSGEKEVSKHRADVFFRLGPGEFVTFADGRDKKVQFTTPNILRELPKVGNKFGPKELEDNYKRIFSEVSSIFN